MKGRIGKSILKLSAASIDLGMSWQLGQTLQGALVVSNHSDLLPLRYQIEAPEGVELDSRRGELTGRKKSDADSHRRVGLTLRCEEWGHLLQQLTVTNLSASTPDAARVERHTVILQVWVSGFGLSVLDLGFRV